jgi:DNA-directed RNA polymerase subunit K/omega
MARETDATSLVENLRSTSAAAVAHQARIDSLREKESTRASARRARQLEAAARQFVALNLDQTVTELVDKATSAARTGAVQVTKEWEVDHTLPILDIQGELKKRMALRDAVAEHFTKLNFEVDTLDYRRQFQHTYETWGRSDEGYYPTEPREFVTGVVVAWGGQED